MVRRIFRSAAVVLLVVVCLILLVQSWPVLYSMASLLGGPALPTPQERVFFTVDFTLPDVQGNLVRLFDLRGQPVLINIWATWCYPCRAEMPSINALYHEYQTKGLAIVAIAIDEGGKPAVTPFMQAYTLSFRVLLDPQNMLGAQLQMPGIPTSYLLDKRGRIVYRKDGLHNWHTAAIRDLVDQLLAEEGGGTTP